MEFLTASHSAVSNTLFILRLKTHYFQSAYTLPPSTHPQCALILFWDFGAI